jgi:hypothetical protein
MTDQTLIRPTHLAVQPLRGSSASARLTRCGSIVNDPSGGRRASVALSGVVALAWLRTGRRRIRRRKDPARPGGAHVGAAFWVALLAGGPPTALALVRWDRFPLVEWAPMVWQYWPSSAGPYGFRATAIPRPPGGLRCPEA